MGLLGVYESDDPDQGRLAAGELPRERANVRVRAGQPRDVGIQILDNRYVVLEKADVAYCLVLKREPLLG